MRLLAAALFLSLLSGPAGAAPPLGSPAPATPTDVDRFNGPNPGNVPEGSGLPLRLTGMERLRQVCNGSTLRDQRTCARAWEEINAAYVQLQATRKAEGSTRD